MNSNIKHIEAIDGKYIKIGTFVGKELYLSPKATNEAYSEITEEEKAILEIELLNSNEE